MSKIEDSLNSILDYRNSNRVDSAKINKFLSERYSIYNGVYIDNEMHDCVSHLNDIGITTMFSCSGHNRTKTSITIKGLFKIKNIDVQYNLLYNTTTIQMNLVSLKYINYMRNIIKFNNFICNLKLSDFIRITYKTVPVESCLYSLDANIMFLHLYGYYDGIDEKDKNILKILKDELLSIHGDKIKNI